MVPQLSPALIGSGCWPLNAHHAVRQSRPRPLVRACSIAYICRSSTGADPADCRHSARSPAAGRSTGRPACSPPAHAPRCCLSPGTTGSTGPWQLVLPRPSEGRGADGRLRPTVSAPLSALAASWSRHGHAAWPADPEPVRQTKRMGFGCATSPSPSRTPRAASTRYSTWPMWSFAAAGDRRGCARSLSAADFALQFRGAPASARFISTALVPISIYGDAAGRRLVELTSWVPTIRDPRRSRTQAGRSLRPAARRGLYSRLTASPRSEAHHGTFR